MKRAVLVLFVLAGCHGSDGGASKDAGAWVVEGKIVAVGAKAAAPVPDCARDWCVRIQSEHAGGSAVGTIPSGGTIAVRRDPLHGTSECVCASDAGAR